MKYYKLGDQIYAFELDGSQDEYIKPKMVLMTDEESDRHINPQKYFTEEQKYELHLKSLAPLTRRQFKLALLDNGLLEAIEAAINNITDPTVKARIQIEYSEATTFIRTSDSVKYMLLLLDLTENQANTMWEQAATL